MQQRTSVEIQAYSVDEAVRLALEELGLGHDDVDIEILSDAGPDEDAEALVRVTAKGMASQPVPSSGSSAASGGAVRDRGSRPRQRGRGGRQMGHPLESHSRPAARPAGGNEGNGRPRRDNGDHWLAGRASPDDRPSQRGAPPRRDVSDRVDTEQEKVARDIASELLSRMGIEAEVVAVDNPSAVPPGAEEPSTIFLDILGHDLGMLIGRRGDHLSHIQYLISMLVNHRLGAWTRVIVDVEGYRTRREESLVGLAERVARQVARSQRPIELEPMPPNERRIIHLTLQAHPTVSTQSTGEGNQRRITVEPRA